MKGGLDLNNPILTMVILPLLTVLFFLPAIIGGNKKRGFLILLVNTLLGWTVIFWIVALVWALLDAKKEASAKWYHTPNSLICGFLIVGPLILPAVWTHPRLSRTAKIVITVICLVLTYFLFAVVAKSMKVIVDYYGLMFK